MILFLLRVLITFFIIFLLYWGTIELLWEEDKISDEWHDFIREVGSTCITLFSIGGIVVILLMFIWFLWKGE